MAEQMTWLTPQAVNQALTPAPLTNNVLAGMQQGQQAGFINALSGLDVNDPDYLNKYATAAVKAGMDHTLGAIADLKQKNFERQVGANALASLKKGPTYLAGTQSPVIGNQTPPATVAPATEPTTQSDPAPQSDPAAVASLHHEIINQETALMQIPAGPQRTAAAQLVAQHLAENRGVDTAAIQNVVANINTPGFLEKNIQDHMDAIHALPSAGAQVPATENASVSQSPAVAPQVATDTGSQNPAGTVAATPVSPRDATYDAARDTLSNDNAEQRAVLKAYTPIDLSEEATNARTLLAPQLSGESAAQSAANTPFEATMGTMAGDKKGTKVQFASRAAFNADQAAHPGFWETPSANEMSGAVELTIASNGAKVSFPNQAAAEQAVKDHPGLYGEQSTSEKARQNAAASTYSIPNKQTGQTEVFIGVPPPAGGAPAAGLQPNAVDADKAIRAAIPGAVLTSGFRTGTQNAAAGGVQDSAHLAGEALDYRVPKGTDPNAMASHIKQMYPSARVIYEGPGAANSTGPHVHVQFPVQAATAPTGGYQVGATTTPAQAADLNNYTQDLTTYTDQKNIRGWQNEVTNGLNVKNLAGTTNAGPLSNQIIDVATKFGQMTGQKIPQGLTNLSQLQHFLQLSLASSPANTDASRATMAQALGSINNPSELLKYAGAVHAAQSQYELDYAKFLRDYKGSQTRSDVTKAWLATDEGRDGIYGVNPGIWHGATIDGKPVVQNLSNGRGGRVDRVWAGRDNKGNPVYRSIGG